jgi:ubiquinone/menaquinone biosynthesis C-methylase UbiE
MPANHAEPEHLRGLGDHAVEEHRHPLAPVHPANAFAGLAEYYARYRPRYPQRLLDALRLRTGTDGTGRLLDLATGTGELALAFRQDFSEIWAIDAEPEMIALAQRKATSHGIHWLTGRAEDLDAPAGHFDLITVGRAFHRLNKPVITKQAMTWLKPGGHLADLGAESGILQGQPEPWQRLAYDTFRHWTRTLHDEARPPANSQPMVTTHEMLIQAGFADLEEIRVWTPSIWTTDQVVGYFYSLSVSSKTALGDLAPGFERDLRARLLAHEPQDRFPELIRAYYILGRRPS